MTDEVVKLILDIENKAEKDLKKFDKDLNKLKKTSEGASKGIGKFNKETSRTGRGFSGLSKNLKGVGGGLKNVATAFAAVAAAMGAVVAQTVKLNKELAAQANFANIGIEEFQRLAFAAQQYGGTAEDVADALNELTIKSQEALRLGSGNLVDVLRLAKVSIAEFASATPEERLFIFADALKEVGSDFETFLQDEGASDSLRRLSQLLREGSEAIKEFGASLEVISAEDNKRVGDIGKAFNELSTTFNRVLTEGVAEYSEEVVYAILKTQELIQSFSDGTFARPVTAAFDLVFQSLKLVGQLLVTVYASIKNSVSSLFSEVEALQAKSILGINGLLKKVNLDFLSDESVKDYKFAVKDAESESKASINNIIERWEALKDQTVETGAVATKFGKLTAQQQVLLEKALDGRLKKESELKQALLSSITIYGEASKQTQFIKNQLFDAERAAEKLKKQVKELSKITIPFNLDQKFKKAQIELFKLQGNLKGAFEVQFNADQEQIRTEVDGLIQQVATQLSEIGEEVNVDTSQIKFGEDFFDTTVLKGLSDQINSIQFEDEKIQQNLTGIIDKIQKLSEYQQLLKDQNGIAILTQDIEALQLQLQLGEATPDQVLAAMVEKLNAMAQVLPANSAELLAFRLEVEKMQEDLDVLGAITDKFAEDFASGMAKAFTDSLSGGEDFVSGMKNLLRDLALSFIEATIRALILTAIMRGINGGGTTTFSQDFTKNLGGSFGIDVGKFHNGTGSGTVGDDNGLRNGTKNINLLNPAGSLNSNEIFAVLKKDEAVVQTSSLNSPTGVGSQEVQQEINVNNFVGEDNLGALLETPNNKDRIINIINSERDRIIL